jgi:tetratricopeptide (TPR) repeat protein
LLSAPAERFDMQVRNDFFAGFAGNAEAMDRGMKAAEDALAANPKFAEAMVWHGSGRLFQAGQLFQKGDFEKGGPLWQKALQEMDDAVALEPENVAVIIPRGATLLTSSLFVPDPNIARPLVEKAVGDYEKTLALQKDYFDTLGSHPRGQLLFGLAEGYSRLENNDKAREYFERVKQSLPDTEYAKRASKWLETKTLTQPERLCTGCHVSQ